MAGRGAADGGDDGVVVRVWMVRVVHCGVVPVVLRRRLGDADFRFAYVAGTRRLEPARVVLFGNPVDAVVVAGALAAAYHRGVRGSLGERDLPLVAHLGGLGVAQDFGALQGAVGREARGSRAGDVIHLLAGRRDVDGQLGSARHRLWGLGASPAHDGARLGVVEVVVVGGSGGGAQVAVVDAGGGHGVAVRGAGGPTRAGGGVG